MLANERLLVAVNGADVERLVGFAAMLARLDPASPARDTGANAPVPSHGAYGGAARTAIAACTLRSARSRRAATNLPEVRVLSLQGLTPIAQRLARAIATERVELRRGAFPSMFALNVDLVKGGSLKRLPALANDFDCDMLLVDASIGSHRQRARLAATTECPVWFVPADSAPVLRRILVPIDFSTQSAAGLQAAIDLASRFRPAKCVALYVEPDVSRLQSNDVPEARRRELDDEFATLMTLIDTHGVEVEPRYVRDEQFGRAVERAARELSADLTVLTSRRRTRLGAAIHPGRTESALRHLAGTVLVLKPARRPLGILAALVARWRGLPAPHFS